MHSDFSLKTYSSFKHHLSVPNHALPPRSNARRPPGNGQPRRRPEHPPELNTIFCLNFVSTTFLQQGGAHWSKFVRPVVVLLPLFLVVSPRVQDRSGKGNMVFIVVEAVLASSKPPPADDGMRTSSSGRYGFGASAPLLMRAPPMYFSGAGGSAIYCRSGSNSSGRPQPGQKSYLHTCFSICCSALRTLTSLRVSFYVYLHGETRLLSLMLQSC